MYGVRRGHIFLVVICRFKVKSSTTLNTTIRTILLFILKRQWYAVDWSHQSSTKTIDRSRYFKTPVIYCRLESPELPNRVTARDILRCRGNL
ncbi:hypothetical protein RRG08_040682 [Elysia crispata]|uniref:Uncharacterized protein n=1 Tax=Elysia crispata TaxID=231223 RepID=A0AAE1E6C3_9GAST|nr:hypothetical protein RRG08_040682 [Elysia crispata]